jgi:Major royal jelly protein
MLENNETIVSVFRIRADKCDRLWVIDTGLDNVLGDAKQIVPTSIAIFDLKTDTLLRRAYFNEKMAKEDSFFANIVSSLIHQYEINLHKITN